MTTKDKNMKVFEERQKRRNETVRKINEQLKKKDYVLTVYQTGDEILSHGKPERQILPRRCYAVCSLEEIPEYINGMKKPYWEHDKGLSEEEMENYPFDKKRWGRTTNIIIEPLSEELEKSYLGASKKGFFKDWRMIRDDDEREELE